MAQSLTNRQTFNPKSSNGFSSIQKSPLDLHTYHEFRQNRELSILHKKDKLKNYDSKLIEIKRRRQEIKRKTFDEEIKKKNEIKSKEIHNEKLIKNISSINTEINDLFSKLETNKEKEMILINSNKEKYLNQIKEKISSLKEIRKEIRKLKEKEREKRENEKMLEEEISQSKRELLNLTSKMESHIELISNVENKSENKNSNLILTPKTNFEFTNDITMNQFKSLNRNKLWNFVYEKIKIFNEKIESLNLNDSKVGSELSFSNINKKSFSEIDGEKEIFVKKMTQIEVEENFKTFNELSQKFLIEIQNFIHKTEFQLKNSQIEADLKILLLSHIKLLIYEDLIQKRMKNLHKLKPSLNNIISKDNQQICNLYSRINKKMKKIKKYREKLQSIENEEKIFTKDEEMNLLNIKSMEKDLEGMIRLQKQNEIEIDIMKNELKAVRLKYEEKNCYFKIKKRKIKDKMKNLQELIEEKLDKLDAETDLKSKIYAIEEKFKINAGYNKYTQRNQVDDLEDTIQNNHMHYRNFKYDYIKQSNSQKQFQFRDYSSSRFNNKQESTKSFSNTTSNFYSINNNPKRRSTEKQRDRERDRDRSANNTPYNLYPKIEEENLNNLIKLNNKINTDYSNNYDRNNYKPNININTNYLNNNINVPDSDNSTYPSNPAYNSNTTPMFNKNKHNLDLFYDYSKKPLLNKEIALLDKIRPLLLGNTVYKRYFVNINKKNQVAYDNYGFNPVDFQNGKINTPEDFNFYKCFLCIDKNISKLLFNKIKEDDKSFEINLTSISKIVVPKITKDVIFIKQIYKKINQNKISDANSYIEKNLGKLVQMYHSGIKSELAEIDEKLFDEDYRSLLLKSNRFMLYIYLKPDEETRIELILNEYEDFKHWINGMENILKNKELKEIIKKRI